MRVGENSLCQLALHADHAGHVDRDSRSSLGAKCGRTVTDGNEPIVERDIDATRVGTRRDAERRVALGSDFSRHRERDAESACEVESRDTFAQREDRAADGDVGTARGRCSERSRTVTLRRGHACDRKLDVTAASDERARRACPDGGKTAVDRQRDIAATAIRRNADGLLSICIGQRADLDRDVVVRHKIDARGAVAHYEKRVRNR